MLYIITGSYCPHTAPTNRIMAYVEALSKLGVKVNVVFLFPDKDRSVVEKYYPQIGFRYLWKTFYIDLPVIRLFILRYHLRRFVNSLSQGDTVYSYGYPDVVKALASRSDIRIFSEVTEHPNASFVNFISRTTISEYFDCAKRIAGVFVISEALKSLFIEKGCNPDRVHVINMIVDKSRFAGLVKQPVDNPYIAYCGTASNTKDGVDQLIQSFSLIVKKHPEYRLYIIGSTPSKKQRFDNFDLVKQLGLEDKVVFTGVLPSEKVPQLLKNATVLALDRPDNLQAKYGFPTKLGEYLLTSNPVVITSVGEIGLFLKDGISALISGPDCPEDFANKLCWAIDHPIEAELIGKEGCKVAEACFDSMKESQKLVSIIKSERL